MDIIRKCISCGNLKKRKDLIRITKDHTTEKVVIEPDSKIFGRSVYLCYNQSCINNAFKKNKISKVLKMSADIDKSLVDDLLNRGLKGTTDGQFKS